MTSPCDFATPFKAYISFVFDEWNPEFIPKFLGFSKSVATKQEYFPSQRHETGQSESAK